MPADRFSVDPFMERRDLQKDLRLERNFAKDPGECLPNDVPNENEISTQKGENVLSDLGGVAREKSKGGGDKGVGVKTDALNEIAARIQV